MPIPKKPVTRLVLYGQEVRVGLLRVRRGMDPTEFVFPRYFLGDPGTRSEPERNLLGLTGVINQIRLIFDGAPVRRSPWGVLVVEKG